MNFYHLGDFEEDQVAAMVDRAGELAFGAAPTDLSHAALGLFFLAPSLRTSASFQRAAAKLKLQLLQLSGANCWGLETGENVVMDGDTAEHINEAAPVLGSYVDALAVRAFPARKSLAEDSRDPVMQAFLQKTNKPVINMESARWHPCQALADRLTLEQQQVPKRGRLVLTWTWHPKALPHAVANSTVTMASQRGMDVVLLHPPGFSLEASVLNEAQALSELHGGSFTVTHDRKAALQGADVVYAKSWGSRDAWCDLAAESKLREPFRDWCVGPEWLGARAHFMHCLPIRRNVVARDSVLDSPASIVLQQAANRLHAQTSVLETVLAKAPVPASIS